MENLEQTKNDTYTNNMPEESSNPFVLRLVYVVFTAMLLVAWIWFGTEIIS